MKFYKVTVPVGYEVFKLFKANSAEEALDIGCRDLENNPDSWINDGDDLWNRYSQGKAEVVDEDDLDLFDINNKE